MNKLKQIQRGFSLIEVMIGVMILTVAIVSAASLLIGLQRSNYVNVQNVQAYYYAVEGIEAVRNIRDTNWLHNRDWLSGDSRDLWGGSFELGRSYEISLSPNGWLQAKSPMRAEDLNSLRRAASWQVFENENPALIRSIEDRENGVDFYRKISFSEVEGFDFEEAVLLESSVTWEFKGQDYEVFLSEILTNWKDGVF